MDLSGPFRGSFVVASGALTRGVLAGPRFRRLFPDIYVPARLEITLAVRAQAAWLLVEPAGAVSGWSAAELLGASSGPKEAPAEVTVQRFRRPLPGLLIHRESLSSDEVVRCCGATLTSPARTAYDLLRWLDLTEGVAALDALAHRYPFTADDVRALRSRHLGLPGNPSVEAGLRLMDRRADSPMESRMRVALVQAGLPPRVQHPITVDGRDFRLDLAYPDAMLAVEYDGGHHREASQALKDLEREGLIHRGRLEDRPFRRGDGAGLSGAGGRPHAGADRRPAAPCNHRVMIAPCATARLRPSSSGCACADRFAPPGARSRRAQLHAGARRRDVASAAITTPARAPAPMPPAPGAPSVRRGP